MWTHILFSHSSVGGHWGCFRLLVIVSSAAVNTGVQTAPWDSAFHCVGYIPRGGIAGSYGSFVFNFLRTLHAAFHSTSTILHSHQQRTRVPVSPQASQLVFSVFLCSICPDGYEVAMSSLHFFTRSLELWMSWKYRISQPLDTQLTFNGRWGFKWSSKFKEVVTN